MTRTNHDKRLLGALALSACLVGCVDPEPEYEHWEQLTGDEVIESLTSPTLELEATVPDSTLKAAQQPLPGLFEAAHFLGQVLASVDEVSEQDNGEAESELPDAVEAKETDSSATWSTNLYLKMACPGEEVMPPFDFKNGSVEINSPTIKGLDFGPLVDEGQFLLQFRKCDLGPINLAARVPGKYLLRDPEVMAELFDDPSRVPDRFVGLNLRDVENSPVGIVGLACGSATTTCREDVLLGAEIILPDGATTVVTFRGTTNLWYSWQTGGYETGVDIDVELRGANGTAQCIATYGAQGADLTCDAPTLN